MLARILWFAIALLILGLAFFFLAAAIIVGTVLAAVFFARIWWINRKLRRAAEHQIITTDYSVVEREALPQQRLPDKGETHIVEGHSQSPGARRRYPSTEGDATGHTPRE